MSDLIKREDALKPYETLLDDDLLCVRTIRNNLLYLSSVEPEQNACFKCVFAPFKQFQPERKKGRWVKPRGDSKIGVVCSVCGMRSKTISLFCPNCGADMRGEEDE